MFFVPFGWCWCLISPFHLFFCVLFLSLIHSSPPKLAVLKEHRACSFLQHLTAPGICIYMSACVYRYIDHCFFPLFLTLTFCTFSSLVFSDILSLFFLHSSVFWGDWLASFQVSGNCYCLSSQLESGSHSTAHKHADMHTYCSSRRVYMHV